MYKFYILEDLLYNHGDKDLNIVFTYVVLGYMYMFYILEDLLYIHVDKD